MVWRVYLRSHDFPHEGEVSERMLTHDPEEAVSAYRALLRRDDLTGQPMTARMTSDIAGGAIYTSRFDRESGRGRIHPEAPLDPLADQELSREATAWRPER